MGDGDDRDAGPPVGREEQRTGLKWLARAPELEARRGENAVESQRQLLAIARRVERFEIEDADALERRTLNLLHEPREIRVAVALTGLQDRGYQRQLTAVWLNIGHAHETKQPRRSRRDPALRIFRGFVARLSGLPKNRERGGCTAARRVDAYFGSRTQPRDAAPILIPLGQAGLPALRDVSCVSVDRHLLA